MSFFVSNCLLAFYIVMPGPAVWFELFANYDMLSLITDNRIIIIVYSQLITHRELTKTNNNTLTTKIHEKLWKQVEKEKGGLYIIFMYRIGPCPIFIWRCPSFTMYFKKAVCFCRDALMFLPSVWSSLCLLSSMCRFIPTLPVLVPRFWRTNYLTVLHVAYPLVWLSSDKIMVLVLHVDLINNRLEVQLVHMWEC